MIAMVARANKYPSNGQIQYRDRISIRRQGWGGYWMLYATTGGTWTDDKKHFVHDVNSPIEIYLYGRHTITIDPVARTWTVMGHIWASVYKYMRWSGLLPGRDRYRYADKWNSGCHVINMRG